MDSKMVYAVCAALKDNIVYVVDAEIIDEWDSVREVRFCDGIRVEGKEYAYMDRPNVLHTLFDAKMKAEKLAVKYNVPRIFGKGRARGLNKCIKVK